MLQLQGFLGLGDKLMKVVVSIIIFVAPDNLKHAKDIPKPLLDTEYSLIN